MSQDQHPGAEGDFFVTFFLVVSDQDRSRNFYQSVFGGKVLLERDPVILEVANARLILNDGGGPTDDKPHGHPHHAARPRPGQRLPQHPRHGHRHGL